MACLCFFGTLLLCFIGELFWTAEARISRLPNQKPIHGSQIDWKHPLAQGLIGCWLMNEGSGGIIQDISPHGNNGNFASGAAQPSWVGQSVYFDGGDYIDFGLMKPVGSTVTDGFSVLIQYKTTDGTNQRSFMGILSDGAGLDFIIYLNYYYDGVAHYDDGSICLWVRDGAQNFDLYVTGNVGRINGEWHTLLITATPKSGISTGKIYFDGIDLNALTNRTQAVLTTAEFTEKVFLGAYNSRGTAANNLIGDIDLFIFWDHVLPPSSAIKISEDPYCFIKKPQNMALRWLGIPAAAPPAGGGGVPTQPIINVTQFISDEVYAGSLIT